MFKFVKYDDNTGVTSLVRSYGGLPPGTFESALNREIPNQHMTIREWQEIWNPAKRNVWGNRAV